MITANDNVELSELDTAAKAEFTNGLRSVRPDITDEEIEKAFATWWLEPRPPDGPGRPITRERFKRIFGREATAEEQLRLSLRES